ncbi:methylmalonyl-CoA mutase [Leptobacterium flavescens]|uniref:Methylmalonyl-CoA mutase n=1 Tax=Leptobacterium flavescens TaxID=472055 RepID=A0A6P0UP50_9FLAO|nr:methylmalonyl-CoA mutase subunit beta [Leptobacterium flavescens]NER12126.1 methylmalonyl-CoA mutase [Leptobacterium flavescens]
MSEFLFDDFQEVSEKQWKQKIQVDLKGADYNETLIWKTPEGIDVKPFYHAENLTDPLAPSAPGNWYVSQKIYAGNAQMANEKALDTLSRGAESLFIVIPSEDIDLERLFKGIALESVPVYLNTEFLSLEFVKKLSEFLKGKNAQFHLNTDLIGNLARTGNWYKNLEKDHEILEGILKLSSGFTSVLSVDVSLYQNAGATVIQQLAYALAQANEYLNHLDNNGIKDPFTINFNVSIGSNYFFEIAKLRALRVLWNSLTAEYGIKADCHIFAQPTKRNKTLYDYNVNMLRTTTETMSAVLGGANAVCNLAYDAIYHKDNEFADRISRNQLLILKNESYLDKVTNPADGSYYLESLTGQLAEKALDIFKQIEAGGGFLKQLKDQTIQRKIKESAKAEQQHFDEGKEVLLGTNKHPNPNDRMKNDLELYPFVKTDSRKTLIEPVIEKRLAEKMEKERLDAE